MRKSADNNILENLSCDWSKDSIRRFSTPSASAREFFLYIQEIGYFKTYPSYYTERKNLQSFLILYTISGTGKLSYSNMECQLEAGSCIFIDCRQHHRYENASRDLWEFYWIHFNGYQALAYYKEYSSQGSVVANHIKQPMFHDQMTELLMLVETKKRLAELLVSSRLCSLITELLLHTLTEESGHASLPGYICEMLEEIDANYMNDLSLQGFSDKYGLSRFYMTREFKKYMGMPLYDYIIGIRISRAKELLRYTDKPVTQIANEVGITNVTHFINLFKKRENATPLAYRKSWCEKPFGGGNCRGFCHPSS